MLSKKIFSFLIASLTFILFLSNYQFVYGQELFFSVKINDYEFNRNTKTIKSSGHIFLKNKVTENAELMIDFTVPENFIGLAVGYGVTGTLGFKLNKYIDENYNSNINAQKPSLNFIRKWLVLLRPILDKNNNIRDVIFCIEKQRNIEDNKFIIEDFILKKEEFKNSKDFSYLNNGDHIDDIIKNNKNIKMVAYETPEKIYYVDFEFAVLNESTKSNTSKNNSQSLFGVKTVKAPFTYDIKYENSSGKDIIIDNIKQEDQFVIAVASKDTINPITKKSVTLKYNLKGKILPLEFVADKLNVQFILTAEDLTFDGNGKKIGGGESSFIKEISFNSNDVVEVKLPENWPKAKTNFGYDPVTLKKQEYNWAIDKQSLFIKPQRK